MTTSAQPKLPRITIFGKKLFYGWVIVAGGVVSQFFQGLSSQGFTTYLSFLQKTFGWSKALLAGPRSVTAVDNSILGPIEGFLVDKFGPRRIVAIGSLIMGAGFIMFGMTNSLWMFFASSILIDIGTGFEGLLILSVAVNNWFRRNRSIAQSVMLLGYSMASVIGIPALVFIQNRNGWRTSAVITGILIIVIGIPVSMLLRSRPEIYGLLPDGDIAGVTKITAAESKKRSAEYDFSLKQALKTPAFWLISFGSAIGNLGMGAAQVHLFLHLEEDVQLSSTTSALVWSVAGLANIPARLLGGFLGDKLPKNLIVGLSMTLMSVSIFILGIANSLQMCFLYAILYGIGWGMRTPVINAMQGEYFGLKSQGLIRGWLASTSLPFTIAAPVVAGYIASVQGNYKWTFIIMSFVMMAGSSLIFLAKAPKHPVEKDTP
jgi:MFS family permease